MNDVEIYSIKYSTLVVNDKFNTAIEVANVAESLGEKVIAVTTFERFLSSYSPSLRCIVLEVSMPAVCGIEIIRYLGKIRSQASLVLTNSGTPELLDLARKLALALGLNVVATLPEPMEMERLRAAVARAGAEEDRSPCPPEAV